MVEKSSALVLQHLLLGMNAHINLDLGVAVVEVAQNNNLPLTTMHNDFNAINTLLAALTYQVISELNQVSPLLSLAGLHAKNDSIFIQFAMSNARDGAWCFAEDLFTKTGAEYTTGIAARDQDMVKLGQGIYDVHGLLKLTTWIIHLFEMKNPAKITGILNTYQKTYLKVN